MVSGAVLVTILCSRWVLHQTLRDPGLPSNSSATFAADASSSRIPQRYTLVSPAPLVPLSRQYSKHFDFPAPKPSAIDAESSSVIHVSAAVSAPICHGMPSTISTLADVNELHKKMLSNKPSSSSCRSLVARRGLSRFVVNNGIINDSLICRRIRPKRSVVRFWLCRCTS